MLRHQNQGIEYLEDAQGQHQKHLHQKMRDQPSVHAVAVGPNGGEAVSQAVNAAAVGKAEAVHEVIRQQIGFQIAK